MRSRVLIMKEIHKLYAMPLLRFYNDSRSMFVNADDENYFFIFLSNLAEHVKTSINIEIIFVLEQIFKYLIDTMDVLTHSIQVS